MSLLSWIEIASDPLHEKGIVLTMNDDTNAMLVVLQIGLTGLALAVGAALVIRDTIRGRGIWGINTKPVYCPLCGHPAAVRMPANWRQALQWLGGGWTCANCGLEYDKWGRAADENERQRRLNEVDVNPYDRGRPLATDAENRVHTPVKVPEEKRDDA
jgi:hypothetical protein